MSGRLRPVQLYGPTSVLGRAFVLHAGAAVHTAPHLPLPLPSLPAGTPPLLLYSNRDFCPLYREYFLPCLCWSSSFHQFAVPSPTPGTREDTPSGTSLRRFSRRPVRVTRGGGALGIPHRDCRLLLENHPMENPYDLSCPLLPSAALCARHSPQRAAQELTTSALAGTRSPPPPATPAAGAGPPNMGCPPKRWL